MLKIGTMMAGFVVLVACGAGSTAVTTTAINPSTEDVFWAKNQIAEKTDNPAQARFAPLTVMALSNGDRVYCGEMSRAAQGGDSGAFVPFYMRATGRQVQAVNWTSSSAEFSSRKCAEAKSGRFRIDNL